MISATAWRDALRLDPHAAAPLYTQLREQLRKMISSFEPNSLIPSEKELMGYAGVSRATARRAISDLVHEGVLVSRQGLGTFTAPRPVEAQLGQHPAGYTETMIRLGRTPGTKVLESTIVAATTDIARMLEIGEGSQVFVLVRMRLLDGVPCMIERAHLPADLLPGLLEHDLASSLYRLVQTEYGLQPDYGIETITAANADRRLAQLLGVPIASALIATARAAHVKGSQRMLEYTIRHARPDLCSFYVEFTNGGSALADQSRLDPLLVAG